MAALLCLQNIVVLMIAPTLEYQIQHNLKNMFDHMLYNYHNVTCGAFSRKYIEQEVNEQADI